MYNIHCMFYLNIIFEFTVKLLRLLIRTMTTLPIIKKLGSLEGELPQGF